MNSVIECPACGKTCVSVLCWVDTAGDCCIPGEVLEAAGDLNMKDDNEPPQLAFCGDCYAYFGPEEGYVFRVIKGQPMEVSLNESHNQAKAP